MPLSFQELTWRGKLEGVSNHPSTKDEVEYVELLRSADREVSQEELSFLSRPRLNLWSRLPRDLSDFILSSKYATVSCNKRLTIDSLTGAQRSKLLAYCTYWYRSLKRNTRILLYKKYLVGNTNRLRQLLITADGILFKILLANVYPFADDPWTWTKILELQNSIISNLVTNHYKFAKELKNLFSERKSILMDDRSVVRPLKASPRCCTVLKYCKVLNIRAADHRQLWSQIILLQTRFTGLVSDCIDQSIAEFREMVENGPPLQPPGWLDDSIDRLLKEIPRSLVGQALHRAKVVLTNSASTELPEKDGGKGEVYKRLLESGGFDPDEATAGQWLFDTAIDWYHNGAPEWAQGLGFRSLDLRRENVSVVLETGLKARIVTAGSAVAALILQPLSHVLMDVLSSFRELKTGLKGSRNGWELYSSLDMQDPAFRDLIGHCFAFSTDLERATDFAVREIARKVIRDFSLGLGLGQEYVEICLDLWVGETHFVFPNGEVINSGHRVVEMGKPITKAFLMLCHLLALERGASPTIARFNGDDAVIITDNMTVIESYRSRMAQLGFKESPKDTFVSKTVVNYCEEWFILPSHPYECFTSILKSSNMEVCGYIDYPRIRLLLGVSRTRIASSYTPLGKVALLSRDLMWSPRWNPSWWVQGLCYSMQESNLIHEKDMKVAYLPVCLGGGGRSPAFNSSYDLTSYYSGPLRAWREKVFFVLHYYGQYLSLRRSGSDEVVYEIDDMFRTNLRKVHLGNEGENITYDQVVYDFEDFSSENRDQLIMESPDRLQMQVLSLLRREGVIISDRELMVGLMVESAHKFMLGQVDEKLIYTTSSRREVWSIRAKGLLDISNYLYERQFDRSFEECRSFFRRSLLDDLYRRDEFSLIVDLERGRDSLGQVFQKALSDREVKVAQLAGWVFANLDRFKAGLYDGMPRDLLDDDPFILAIARKLDGHDLAIVTADRRLCTLLLEEKNTVLRLSPELIRTGQLDPESYPYKIIEDTGSIQAWLQNHHYGEETHLEPVTHDTLVAKRGWALSSSFRREPLAELFTRQRRVQYWSLDQVGAALATLR